MRPQRRERRIDQVPAEAPTLVEAASPIAFEDFSRWMDHELAKLEFNWRNWSTPGYGYWRSSLGDAQARGR
ncbi:MAG: hypothetical protein K2Y37_22500 [Pirellulales bacterium]|nr:hypothetical protein [Pirellulales bacterium]